MTITSVTSPVPDQSLVWNAIRVPFNAEGLSPMEPSIAVEFFATCRESGAGTHPDCHRKASWRVTRPFVPRTSTM